MPHQEELRSRQTDLFLSYPQALAAKPAEANFTYCLSFISQKYKLADTKKEKKKKS
jgi:hypothetical protein